MDTAIANNNTSSAPQLNFRMIAVVLVVLLLIGYPVYTFLDASIHGGAKQVGNIWQVDLKSLGYFPFDEDNGTIKDVPEKWRDLDGKHVALEGFMYVGNSAADSVDRFQFVYNITKCCFQGPPKVQERVFVSVPKGAVPYIGQMVKCVGTLHVNVKKNDAGKTDILYAMDLEKLEQP